MAACLNPVTGLRQLMRLFEGVFYLGDLRMYLILALLESRKFLNGRFPLGLVITHPEFGTIGIECTTGT